MALFTVVMGTGFAAFSVIAGGIGIPVLVGVYHANPAALPLLGANIVLLYFLMYR
jgi:uncharacterized membrane protein